MKKKVLLNLSCLYVLFGGINIAECEAMNVKQSEYLSTLRSIKHGEVQTIVKYFDFNTQTKRFSLKNGLGISDKVKQSFENVLRDVQNKYDNLNKNGTDDEFVRRINAAFKAQNGEESSADAKKEEGEKKNLTKFDQIQDITTLKIGGVDVKLAKLTSGKYSEAKFATEAERTTATKKLKELSNDTETYTEECINELKKCIENLPEVEGKEEEKKNQIIDIHKAITDFNIQAVTTNLDSYEVKANKQAALFVLKERYKTKDLVKDADDRDLVTLLISIVREKQGELYVNNSGKQLENTAFVKMIYKTTNNEAFGIKDKQLTGSTTVSIKNAQTLFPDAIMSELAIADTDKVCDYMIGIYKSKHLSFYKLKGDAVQSIEGKTDIEDILKTLGLTDEKAE